MKKRNIVVLILIMTMSLGTVFLIDFNNKEKKIVNDETKLSKIELNHIAVSADEYDIKKVHFSNNIKKELIDSVKLYKVKAKKYSNKDIKEIVKNGINCKIRSSSEEGDTKLFELSNGGDLTYYKNSGAISYHFYEETNEKTSKRTISDGKLKEKAKKFIKKIKICDIDELSLYKVGPSVTVKTQKGEEIEQYEVMYTKTPPQEIDGYEGTGPGIVVEFDCNGEIVGFVAIDKEIEAVEKKYPTKDIKEMEKDIVDGDNVMIYSNKEVENKVNLDNLECVLYSDSVEEKQEYMVPHYRFKDKNQDGIDIVLPAIKNSYLSIK